MPELLTILLVLLELASIAAAVHAIFNARSSQGSTAWAISLVTFPFVAFPLYLVFGRRKFHGYVNARRAVDRQHEDLISQLRETGAPFLSELPDQYGELRALERLVQIPFVKGNCTRLLIDGEETFGAIFEGIDQATRYLLVQFYIVHDDALGRELKRRLIERARAGVRVFFLYDEIGSNALPRSYIDECRQAGIHMRSFHTTKGKRNRFQINFRNHRKIVVVDGRVSFVGGLNVGDEYMGLDEKVGAWRDTHLRVEGPASTAVQLAFLEDWHWASGEEPDGLEWEPRPCEGGDRDVLVLPGGPGDDLETCGLMFLHAINSARRRIWIASPYYVPNSEVVAALQLAALRGVDVRILLPLHPDNHLVHLASFSFIQRVGKTGVKFFRYREGFMHQKVVLIDENAAAVGTANLDNRSFRLNFEIMMLVVNADFAAEVETMFLRDFERSDLADPNEIDQRNLIFQFGSRFARLLSPVL